jgi:hypothetical protein
VEADRMGNIKYNDEMDLIYMLIDLTGINTMAKEKGQKDCLNNLKNNA